MSGDPYPYPIGWGGYQPFYSPPMTWYVGPPPPDWIIRKCISCSKDFPTRPIEGQPLPDQCGPCLCPPQGGTGS